ncbi:MAG: pitrilysin family protein [Myxococcota bacterium]
MAALAVHVETRTLGNGLRVVAVEQPSLHAADVSLFIRCGSRHETIMEWGLSHFLEHMVFRGTERFSTGYELACAFERHGASLNAATWRDHTHFETTTHPSTVLDVLRVLGEMITRPRFEGIKLERNVVEEEIYSDLDEEGEDVDLNNVSRAAIWRGHAMGRRITGSLESLRAFTTEDLRRHHERFYVARNSVLCVSGRIKAEDVFQFAAQAFQPMRSGKPAADLDRVQFAPARRLALRDSEGSQTSVALSFEALPDPHERFVALELMTRILDDGLGSRLHRHVCEERGLAYDLTSGLDCYHDCGLYDVELSVAPHRAAGAVAAVLETLEELCEHGVSPEELDLVRDRALHELEYALDSAAELSTHFGTSALFRSVEPLARDADRLRALDANTIDRVARDILRSGRLHCTVVGPLERTRIDLIEQLIGHFAGDQLRPGLNDSPPQSSFEFLR